MAAEIQIEGLAVSMRRGAASAPTRAIDALDLQLPAASICSVVGRSGCGKTTLLSAIAGILDPAEADVAGSIRLSRSGASDTAERPAIGMVFQRSFLLPWATALENVALSQRVRGVGATVWKPEAERLLERVGLAEHAHKYPHQLSGGMQQRVALTREFARPLDVLLLDEPFASLDRVTRDQLYECLLLFWSDFKPTILLVTHDPEEAVQIGDRVVVLEAGRVVGNLDVASKLPRNRNRDVRTSSTFRDFVECTLDLLHGSR